MLIKFQPNGTEFAVEFQGDRFVKGDVGVHEVNVVVLDENFDKYNSVGYVQFRRNGETTSSPALSMANKTFNIAGALYNGYTFKMNSEWYCAIAGVLKATVEIKTYDSEGNETVKAYGIVDIDIEDSIAEDVPTTITNEEYNAFIEVLRSKLDIQDEKVYYFKNKTYESYNDFAIDSINQKTIGGTNIYFGQFRMSIGNGMYNNFEAISLVNNANQAIIISGAGELIYTDGTRMLPLSVQGEMKVATPTTTNSATTKAYVDAIDSNLKSNITNTKNELEESIEETSNNLERYIDQEINDVNQAHEGMVNTAKNELNANINSKTSRSNMVNTIGMANSSQEGLISAQDYTLFKKLVGLLNETSSNFVDTLEEVLNIFENYPEGTNLIEKLGEKVDKTTFEEYKEEVNNKLKETDVRYTNLTPTPSALGGIGKGQTFDNVLITDVLNDLLYPYVAFSFTISTSPSAGVKEFNQTINVTSATINITKGSAELSKIEVYNGSTLVGSKTENVTSGSNVITFDNNVSLTKDSSNKTIKAVVTDSTGKSKEQSATFTFVYPYYYGAISASATLTESLITGLTKVVTTSGNKSYTITMSQQKAVYAYPSSYGNLKKILDANSFDVTETFVKNTLTIHGVSYYVYVLDTPATSEMKYTFNY